MNPLIECLNIVMGALDYKLKDNVALVSYGENEIRAYQTYEGEEEMDLIGCMTYNSKADDIKNLINKVGTKI